MYQYVVDACKIANVSNYGNSFHTFDVFVAIHGQERVDVAHI